MVSSVGLTLLLNETKSILTCFDHLPHSFNSQGLLFCWWQYWDMQLGYGPDIGVSHHHRLNPWTWGLGPDAHDLGYRIHGIQLQNPNLSPFLHFQWFISWKVKTQISHIVRIQFLSYDACWILQCTSFYIFVEQQCITRKSWIQVFIENWFLDKQRNGSCQHLLSAVLLDFAILNVWPIEVLVLPSPLIANKESWKCIF